PGPTPADSVGLVDAAELLATELADRVDAAFAAVYVAPNGERAELVATTIPPPTLPPLPALVRRALSTRRFVSASRSELAELRRGGFETADAFAVPLLVGRSVRGALLALAPKRGWRELVPQREAA